MPIEEDHEENDESSGPENDDAQSLIAHGIVNEREEGTFNSTFVGEDRALEDFADSQVVIDVPDENMEVVESPSHTDISESASTRDPEHIGQTSTSVNAPSTFVKSCRKMLWTKTTSDNSSMTTPQSIPSEIISIDGNRKANDSQGTPMWYFKNSMTN
ncbi:hypothetical protein Pcinc_003695 [Petrolisthes cinctipes]|uniref:Uncharacterized protein n=1 Tax=Petrolisthes cinctipes TaxID=88211 RepID=A0AAE1L2B1_PETCI|nr:hypothetical protein Pcinc_003695 [Petrolisthes cinctipes]